MNKTIAVIILIGVACVAYLLLRGNEAVAPASVPNGSSEENQVNTSIKAAVSINPISHASFVLQLTDSLIVNDPVGEAAAFTAFGTPDIVLLSDTHGDHLNLETLAGVVGPETVIVAPDEVYQALTAALQAQTMVLANGEELLVKSINIEAVPMYNLPEQGVEIRHVEGRGNGYIVNTGERRIYIAGDTANTPEMQALENIDIAFVPMNLPYTMSVEDAAAAVIAFAPTQVYPYHYRTPDGFSDVARFAELVQAGAPEVEVVQLAWYPATN